MKNSLSLLLAVVLIFSGCKKESSETAITTSEYGTKAGTWTFTEGSHTYAGNFAAPYDSALLDTVPLGSDTYIFEMLGTEKDSGFVFSLIFSLHDTDFTVTSYQSGVDVSEDLNAFYFSRTVSSLENIYESANMNPGATLNYTITAFDPAKAILTIEFHGQAMLDDGTVVNITKGKLTIPVAKV